MTLRAIVDEPDDGAQGTPWPHTYPRPRNNADLIGHDRAEAALRNAWESGRMAHGWLITGPPGVGKATLAYRLARFVLSRSAAVRPRAAGGGLFGADAVAPPETGGEGLAVPLDDAAARRAAQGAHADMMTVERTVNDKTKKLRSEIVVDDVRKVRQVLSLTPGEGTWRVVVVDSADELNVNAANALLKMLEEPPTRSLMVLTSATPGRLLPTIRSRCRRLDLTPVDAAAVAALLDAMAPDAAPGDRAAAAALAGGSPGRALSLIEQGGLAVFADLMRALEAVARGRADDEAVGKVVAAISKADSDAALAVFFDTLQTLVHGVCALAAGRTDTGGARAATPQALLDIGRALAGQGSLDSWLAVWDNLGRARGQVTGLNLDRRQIGRSLLWSIEQAARG
jgi:DNA polymerase-3 subunit delta'